MRVIEAIRAEDALDRGIHLLLSEGVERDSRNGKVLVAPFPVATTYERPMERVLRWPLRDSNPFFHLMEALWMLGGRHDVAFVSEYVKRMKSFSDDGVTQHGAYGFRWREWFGRDQLKVIVERLRKDSTDRRCVLGMWDPVRDLDRSGADVPCNTHAYVSRDAEGRLDLTVCCRSNDIIWGAYGANVVHFSFLLEYLAGKVGPGCEPGKFVQISNNFHAYRRTLDPLLDRGLGYDPVAFSLYAPRHARRPLPLRYDDYELASFDGELRAFLEGREPSGSFLRRVAVPMRDAYRLYKSGDLDAAIRTLRIADVWENDWHAAGLEWLDRRRSA